MTDNDGQPLSDDNLDDVFDGKEEVEETVVSEAEEEPEGEESETEDVEDEAEPPAAEEEVEEKSVPVAALKSERQKRQAAEAELLELKKKIAPEEDEEDVDEAVFVDRANISREVLIEAFPDYEEKEAVFAELASKDKNLRIQLRQSKNPAKFAYQKAKEHLEIEEIKSLKSSDDWTAFQRWKKEQNEKPVEEAPEVKRKRSALAVPNLNRATSVKSNSTPLEKLETLDDLFED